MTKKNIPALAASLLLAAVAAVCIAIILRGGAPVFGDPLKGSEIWLLSCFALGGLVGAAIAFSGGIWSGLLAALLIAGGGAQLWLTEPDWFPSLRIRPVNTLHFMMMGLVAFQGAASFVALLIFARGKLVKTVRAFGALKLLPLFALSAAFCVATMNYLNPLDLPDYAVHLVAGGAAVIAFLLNAAAFAAAPDAKAVTQRLSGVPTSRATPWIAAAFAFIISAVMAHAAFGGASLVEDETAYLFQAKTFANGALAAPAPPEAVKGAFDHYLLDLTDKGWFAVTAPGYAAALAIAVFFGLPLFLNPALGAASVLFAHRITSTIADRQRADLVAVLTAASPWLLFSSASLMTHALSLALTLGAAALALDAVDRIDAKRKGGAALLFIAGLLMGWLFVTRALEGVLLGGALGVFLLLRLRMTCLPGIIAYGVGCIIVGLLLFAFNAAYTGDPTLSPQARYITALWGPHGNSFGFGADIGPPEGWGALDLAHGHSPLEGLVTTQNGVSSMSYDLFGWTAGSLALFWAWALWGERKHAALVMAGLTALIVGVHFFYWFNASFYIGPRYWYGAFFPIVFLSVAGIDAIARRIGEETRPRLVAATLLLCVFGSLVFTSWRAVEKYAVRSEDGRRLAAIARSSSFNDAIIILRDADLAQESMIFNDPFLRDGAPIFAYAKDGTAEKALLDAFPQRRPVYLDRAEI
ncbi:MAG: hypothetical protein AB7F91_16915 [Parvularculaceae bacterium]